MINRNRRTLLTSGAAIIGAASLPLKVLSKDSLTAEYNVTENSLIAGTHLLNAEDTQIIFADLHPVLVNMSTTNPPSILAGNAGGLAKIASKLSIPMTFLTVFKGDSGQIVPELSPYASSKNTIFRTNADPFKSPAVVNAIHEKKRNTIVVCGYTTEVAVLFTALGAISQGYRVQVPVDCIGSNSERTEAATLKQMDHAGVVETSALSIVANLAPDFTKEPGTTAFSVISDILSRNKKK